MEGIFTLPLPWNLLCIHSALQLVWEMGFACASYHKSLAADSPTLPTIMVTLEVRIRVPVLFQGSGAVTYSDR